MGINRLNKVLALGGALFFQDFGKKAGEEHHKRRVGVEIRRRHVFPVSQHCPQGSSRYKLTEPSHTLMRKVLLLMDPIFIDGETERSSNVPKITQLVRAGSRIHIHTVWLQMLNAMLPLKPRFICHPLNPLISKWGISQMA